MTSVEEARDAMLAALNLRIPRPKISAVYRLAVLAVAGLLILLPLVYLAIIGFTTWGVWLYAAEMTHLLSGSGGRGRFVAYFGPILIGVVLVLFMFKPIFAPRAEPPERLELDPDNQPFLHEFVRRLCIAVGAPAPRRILVDAEVNASAGFHHGGTGLLSRGRELTIGLPLAAGFRSRELAGVLAHEFGHFAQGGGMRVGFFVHRMNSWFARVAYARDVWDERLESLSKSGVGAISWVAYAARGIVWLTRRVLIGLVWIASVASAHLSRQMEFDADRYEIRMAGSESFCRAMRDIVALSAARDAAVADAQESWQTRRLPDDLVGLTMTRAGDFGPEMRSQVEAMLEAEPAQLFATHPRSADRMAEARVQDEPGVFEFEEPASIWFDEFDVLCQEVTEVFYADALGADALAQAKLVPAKAADQERRQTEEDRAAGTRVMRAWDSVVGGLDLPAELPPAADPEAEDAADAKTRLAALRDAQVSDAEVQQRASALQAIFQERLRLDTLTVRQKLGFANSGSKDRVERAEDRLALTARLEELDAMQVEAQAKLDEVQGPASARIVGALAARRAEGVATETRERIEAMAPGLLATHHAVAAEVPLVPDLYAKRGAIATVAELMEPELDEAQRRRRLGPSARAVRDTLLSLRERLDGVVFPYEHSSEGLSLGEFIVPRRPGTDPQAAFDAAGTAAERLLSLHSRLLASLAVLVESIEDDLGLERMEPLGEADPPADA